MQPMQFSSFAVCIGNQPSLLGAVRQANTSTGHTARQQPQALHMSSPITTSDFPAGPLEASFSVLNSGLAGSEGRLARAANHHLEDDLLGARDVGPREPLGHL